MHSRKRPVRWASRASPRSTTILGVRVRGLLNPFSTVLDWFDPDVPVMQNVVGTVLLGAQVGIAILHVFYEASRCSENS
jgi:hypothetical protein